LKSTDDSLGSSPIAPDYVSQLENGDLLRNMLEDAAAKIFLRHEVIDRLQSLDFLGASDRP
jgi:hypothetical protein